MSLTNKSISHENGLILLYHSITDELPASLEKNLHNIRPHVFERHLRALSEYFEFVSLDEYSKAASKTGLATITFDDGYKNVFKQALPILQSLNYPFCLFINPITFEGNFNWRDKVRYLIEQELVDDFLSMNQLKYSQGRFYRFSKNPQNNSARLDVALDDYLSGHKIDIYIDYPYLKKEDLLINHPLISYGNHSYNHYVLASLDRKQQYNEINRAQQALSQIRRLQVSRCFSAPFGGTQDVNESTFQIIEKLGMDTVLMSRQRLQSDVLWSGNTQVLERFMPRSDDIFSELAGKSIN